MNLSSDLHPFGEMMNTCCEALGKPKLSADALTLYFALLEPYSLPEVNAALYRAMACPQSSFGLTPALILQFLGASTRPLEWEDIIKLARDVGTPEAMPIGVLARMKLKSSNLKGKDDIKMKADAKHFLDELPKIRERALAGDYTINEIVCMVDHDVKVSGPFMKGMPGCQNMPALEAKYRLALESPMHRANVDRKESMALLGLPINKEGQLKMLAEIKEGLKREPVQIVDDTNERKAKFNEQVKGMGIEL
jgi:hypothetical protein